jgi:hypothetical protein
MEVCNQCKSEVIDYTTQEDKSIWCKSCYDEGFNLLFKGMFTKEEVDKEKKDIKKYIEFQKDFLRKVFKIAKIYSPSNIEKFLENCRKHIDLLIKLEEHKCKELKITRTEILKDYKKHKSISSYTDKDFMEIFSIDSSNYFSILRMCKLNWDSNIIDYPSLYKYYNQHLPV